MARVTVLIPTCNRKTGLAMVLTSLLGQTFTDFDVVISDQTPGESPLQSIELSTAVRALRWHGHRVEIHTGRARRGMAEQRHFLLSRAHTPYVHFIDDDVLLDPGVMERMLLVLRREGGAFVGCPATGLEYLDDVRPHQQRPFETWDGPVRPEALSPETLPTIWDRHMVNNAANPLHLEKRLTPDGHPVPYKLAWVGGANVLFDREKLVSVGGFSWWRRLPPNHAGEEVVAQFLLIRKYGGCGLLPSGTYHLGLPTNVADRTHNATALFAQLVREYDVEPVGEVEPLPEPVGAGA